MTSIRHSNNKLNVYYQNARGMRTKTNIFYRNVCSNNYDIILLTEMWLVDGIADSELFDCRYVVWRRDRNYAVTRQRKGGGILIATRKELLVIPQISFQSSAEDLWITLSLGPNSARKLNVNLHICVLYLIEQKFGYSFSEQLSNFFNNLNNIITQYPDDRYLVVGDFNMSSIVWTPSSYDNSLHPSNCFSRDEHFLVDEMSTLNFKQYNGIKNKFGVILDLVLCTDSVSVDDCEYPLSLPADPHHGALIIQMESAETYSLQPAPFFKYLFNRGNYESINNEISKIDWIDELSSGTVDEAVTFFYNKFVLLRDLYVPSKRITNKSYPNWYSAALIKLLNEKHRYFKKFKRYGKRSDEESFKLLRDRAKNLENTCYRKYIKLVEDSIQNNPKQFWSYIKSKKKSSSLPCCLHYGANTFNAGDSISEAFSKFFHSSFLTSSSSLVSPVVDVPPMSVASLGAISVEEIQVCRLLKQLDSAKSAGPDQLPAIFLIRCSDTIALPITLLFRRSLTESIVPDVWKRAYVTPIFKKGNRTEVSNYRPISKLCIISKVLEKIKFIPL